MTLKFALLTETAKAPTRKHPLDAGVDLYADAERWIPPHSFGVINTGVSFEVPAGIMLQLWPKSRSNFLVGAGIVDAGYQGEILVKIFNGEDVPLHIEPGMAIAQAVVVPCVPRVLYQVDVDQLYERVTDRGATGGIVGQK